MKPTPHSKNPFWLAPALVMLVACGSATDPINSLGDPQTTPQLQNVVTVTGASYQASPYNASNAQHITWTLLSGISVAILAPANGVITTLNTNEIYITHTPRFVSRIEGNISFSSRVGDYVTAGQTIGVTNTVGSNPIRHSVTLNGGAVCPFSFMSTTAQNEFANTLFTTSTNRQPCL